MPINYYSNFVVLYFDRGEVVAGWPAKEQCVMKNDGLFVGRCQPNPPKTNDLALSGSFCTGQGPDRVIVTHGT